MFSADQIKQLQASLSASHVKERKMAGRKVSYVEGWHAIAEANRIFGFDHWSRETVELKCVAEGPRDIGENKIPGHGVSYIAKVRITVWTEDGKSIVREGTGAGHGIDRDLGQAHESAVKESETDAMKRGLMTFGNPFGLALYDKEQAGVESAAPSKPVSQPATKAPVSASPKPPVDAVAWGQKALVTVSGFRDAKEFDLWYTEAIKGAIGRMPDKDMQDRLVKAVLEAQDKWHPVGTDG